MLTPILLPRAPQLGIDPVHYGTVIVATQGISVFLPPVGVSPSACSVGGVEAAECQSAQCADTPGLHALLMPPPTHIGT